MELTPSGQVLVVDDDHEIRFALKLLLETSGYEVTAASSGEEALGWVGRREFDVALVDQRLPLLQGTEAIERARALRPDLEAVVVTADGTYESAVEALRVGAYDFVEKPFSNDHLLLVVRRAVEHRRMRLAAEAHRLRIEALSTLHAVAHASGASLVVSEILDAAIDTTRERLGLDAAAVFLLEPGGERLALARHRGLPEHVAERARVPVPTGAPHLAALRASEPVKLARSEVLASAPDDPLALDGFESLCVARVGSEDGAVGTLVAASKAPRRFTAQETGLLEAIGREVGPPIQNARIHARATRQAAQLRAVHDITQAINSAQELETVLGLVARSARDLVDASGVAVLLPTEDGSALRIASACGRDLERHVGRAFPVGRSLNGLAYARGEVVTSQNVAVDARADADFAREQPPGPLLILPLVHRQRSLGTISVADSATGRVAFAASDVELLKLLADHGAIAIDNARLRALERAQTAELEARVEERTRELREAQEQLVTRERLAILGRMAGSVSHEIRNPLGVLKNSVYFLRMVLEDHPDAEAHHHLDLMDAEVDRANQIVGDLLEYARVRDPVPSPLSLSDVFERVLGECAVPLGVQVVEVFPRDAPPAMADAEQLQVVFTNLVRNALQAMPRGGTLTLRITHDREFVSGVVEDTGPGITPELRERIFEPLVSTKIKGLGLGLSTAKNLVEMHRGTISVESEPGRGTRVRVRLPVAAGRATAKGHGEPPRRPSSAAKPPPEH